MSEYGSSEPAEATFSSPFGSEAETMSPPTVEQAGATTPAGRAESEKTVENPLNIRFGTFAEAEQSEKKFSDKFIDGCIKNDFKVDGVTVGTKGYLDKVEPTQVDKDLASSPERIVATYVATTEMILRNLKIRQKRTGDEAKDAALTEDIIRSKAEFIAHTQAQMEPASNQFVASCADTKTWLPRDAYEYRGLVIAGTAPLDSDAKNPDGFRANIKIQRQGVGTFIMGCSDARVDELLAGDKSKPDHRIYLNPDIEATPDVFEKLLTAANEAGIPLQLRMVQRAPELVAAHRHQASEGVTGGLRGDGIVVYADEAQADQVLALALAIANETPEAFAGRQTSRIPTRVADGVAVGDEPKAKNVSLTQHRLDMFDYGASVARKSGKTGEEARVVFRDAVRQVAKLNHINPDNIAFNAA